MAGSFYGILFAQLRGKPCEPFNPGMKVRILMARHTRFYYPDGMVVCEPNEAESPCQERPVVVAEVVSGSTRRIDEFEKRDAYLAMPSLAVYLLIEADKPRVSADQRRRGPARIQPGTLHGP